MMNTAEVKKLMGSYLYKLLKRILSSFKISRGLNAIFRNIAWLLTDKFLRVFISIFAGLLVARYLGPEKFGEISYAQNFALILFSVSGLGLDAIVLRELSRRADDALVILGSAFLLRIFCSAVVLFLLFSCIYVGWVEEEGALLVVIISLGMFFQSFGVIEIYFNSLVKSRYVVQFGLFAALLSCGVKVILVVIEAELQWFAASFLLDSVIHAGAMVLCYRFAADGKVRQWLFSLSEAGSLVKDSWYLMVGGLSFVMFYSFDFLIIKDLLGSYEAGIYAAALKFSIIWHVVPGVVISSFKPSVVRMIGSPEYPKSIEFVTGLLVWVAIILFCAGWMAGEELIRVAYGAEYAPAADLLMIMMFANIFVFFFSCWNSWQIIEGRSGKVMLSNLLAVLIKLSAVFLFAGYLDLQWMVLFGVLGICLSFVLLSLRESGTFKLAMGAFFWPLRFFYGKF